MKNIDKNKLFKAKKDYIFLLNKNYPEKSTLELVGNRYKLNSYERDILKRGVKSNLENRKRKFKIIKTNFYFKFLCIKIFLLSILSIFIKKLKENSLVKYAISVDGWNVVITLDNYYKGKPVFISTDGVIRDISETGSSYKITKLTYEIVEKILNLKFCKNKLSIIIKFYFEDNVSKSLDFVKEIENRFNFKNIMLTKNNDPILVQQKVVATSDSQIIDNVKYCIDFVSLYLKKYHKNYLKKIIKL